VEGPLVRREQLALRLEAGPGAPELGGEEEAAEGLGAAGVDWRGGVKVAA
jgi:hypothetical protein